MTLWVPLFSLSIHRINLQLLSAFLVFYLDDSTFGGCLKVVLHDMNTVENIAEELGLQLLCKVRVN